MFWWLYLSAFTVPQLAMACLSIESQKRGESGTKDLDNILTTRSGANDINHVISEIPVRELMTRWIITGSKFEVWAPLKAYLDH